MSINGDDMTDTMKLVPIEPTLDMLIAGGKAGQIGYWEDRVNNISFQREGLGSNDPAKIYAAMIAAAPYDVKYNALHEDTLESTPLLCRGDS